MRWAAQSRAPADNTDRVLFPAACAAEQAKSLNRSKTMNIFYIIGVVVVIVVVAGFLGLHV